MIIPSESLWIVIATKPVDFRKDHDGLASMVQKELGHDPHSGIVVVFRAKWSCSVKVERQFLCQFPAASNVIGAL